MHMLTGRDILRGRADARAVFDHGIACPQGPQSKFVAEGDVPGGRDVPVAGLAEQADRARIEQLLTNVISNAVKYTPEALLKLLQVLPGGGAACFE